MVYKTNCKYCNEFRDNKGKYCSMKCKLKKDNKLFIGKFTLIEFKKVIENNTGIKIDYLKLCSYNKEIRNLIE